MTAPVTVAHVVTRLDVGGAQETVIRICAGLDRSRFHPVIFAGPDVGSGGSLRERAMTHDIEVVDIAALQGPVRPMADVRAIGQVTAAFLRHRVGLVHTHSSKGGAVGRLAAVRAGVRPVVHTVHGWSFNDHQPRPLAACYRGVERLLARRTDALVVVALEDRETGVRSGIGTAAKYILIRSGIALDTPPRVSREVIRAGRGWRDDEHVVISVGRLEAQKDPLALVRAVARARRQGATLRLVLVGGGSMEGAVRSAVCAAGLAGHVDLLGVRDDVADLLAGADSFALASRWEGLPRAVLEAVRAGLPVVATDTGGVGEMIETGRTGWLVRVGDGDRLAEALVEVSRSPATAARWAAAALERLGPFTEQAMVEGTEDLYTSLLAGDGVPRAARFPLVGVGSTHRTRGA